MYDYMLFPDYRCWISVTAQIGYYQVYYDFAFPQTTLTFQQHSGELLCCILDPKLHPGPSAASWTVNKMRIPYFTNVVKLSQIIILLDIIGQTSLFES